MKQHLDTIPVWDAYKQEGECPLCSIRARNEQNYVENFLGASVMEPGHRVEVNQKGFCSRHFQMMFEAGNRLGLALMTHTYLKETMRSLAQAAEQANAAAREAAKRPLPAKIAGKLIHRPPEGLNGPAQAVAQMASGCILCERLDATMERYVYTLLYMWKNESDFRRAFAASKGLCLPHYADALRLAASELSGHELTEFIETLTSLEEKNLARIEGELEWFTLKFDYRNQDKPWGNSQDAVERSINKLRGQSVGGDGQA